MKAGLATSVVLHAAVLGFGLVSLSAPRSMEAVDVETLPVDVVPVDSITQIQQGDREAEMAETPVPVPTTRPEQVEDAAEVGDADRDLAAPRTPEAENQPVETAAAPQVDETQPVEEETSEPQPSEAEEVPQPESAEEVEPEAEPEEEAPEEAEVEPETTEEVEPDPVAEAIESREAETERESLPETAPVPEARPEPVQTARTSETSEAEEPEPAEEAEISERADAEAQESDTLDEVAALLDKQDPSGGGARRSDEEATLGGRETNSGEELTQSELDALRQQLSGCWNRPIGAEQATDLRASVVFNVDNSGSLDGRPRVVDSSGHRQFDESAVRAVELCNRDGLELPEGKQEVWAEIRVNFDPTEMY